MKYTYKVKPYICGQCGKRFDTMAKLDSHLKQFHSEAYHSNITPK